MAHEYLLWVVVIACALHVLEEAVLDWVGWAGRLMQRFGLAVTWGDFYVVNAVMIVGGIAGAMIGWRSPHISLMLPALTAINAIFFHIGATVALRRYAPGTITAVVVYLPVAAWAYYGAAADGVLTGQVIVISISGGAALMAFPVLMLWLKSRVTRRSRETG